VRPFLAAILISISLQAFCAQDVPPTLVAGVRKYIETKRLGSSELPEFKHALADLNNDGKKDAIVLMTGKQWCGTAGCNMLIFQGADDAFTFVSGSTIVITPIRVAQESNNGWRTVIVYARGVGDVLMQFDGKRYPLNPSMQPKAISEQVSAAEIVME
jgi:hypothetical protein